MYNIEILMDMVEFFERIYIEMAVGIVSSNHIYTHENIVTGDNELNNESDKRGNHDLSK